MPYSVFSGLPIDEDFTSMVDPSVKNAKITANRFEMISRFVRDNGWYLDEAPDLQASYKDYTSFHAGDTSIRLSDIRLILDISAFYASWTDKKFHNWRLNDESRQVALLFSRRRRERGEPLEYLLIN